MGRQIAARGPAGIGALQAKYSPEHPDVVRLKREIAHSVVGLVG